MYGQPPKKPVLVDDVQTPLGADVVVAFVPSTSVREHEFEVKATVARAVVNIPKTPVAPVQNPARPKLIWTPVVRANITDMHLVHIVIGKIVDPEAPIQ